MLQLESPSSLFLMLYDFQPDSLPLFCIILVVGTLVVYLLRWYHKLSQKHPADKTRHPLTSQTAPSQDLARGGFKLGDIFTRIRQRHGKHKTEGTPEIVTPTTPESKQAMRYPRHVRVAKKKKALAISHASSIPQILQPYDAFLVLDVEATCQLGTDLNFPNEIIELPICLMRWKNKTEDGMASEIEVVDEFRSFVRPSWRPQLSQFCTDLTGITQEDVDAAPPFVQVLGAVQNFLVKHGLIDAVTGERLVRYCWCSDGPFDIRDFVVKQCFISKVQMPRWIQGDVLDVRLAVIHWLDVQTGYDRTNVPPTQPFGLPRRSLNISAQLKALELPAFEGRQHSGIDDTRNIAKIVTELARRGVCLQPNTAIHPGRRWHWMGKHGQVLEEHCMTFNCRM